VRGRIEYKQEDKKLAVYYQSLFENLESFPAIDEYQNDDLLEDNL
jgi:hypothetical protein